MSKNEPTLTPYGNLAMQGHVIACGCDDCRALRLSQSREQRVCNVLVSKYGFMCWIEHPSYICFPLSGGGTINCGTANAKWELDVVSKDDLAQHSHDFGIPDNTTKDDIQIATEIRDWLTAWNVVNPNNSVTRKQS